LLAARSTQPLPHFSSGAAHALSHAPAEHSSPPHEWPQLPQLSWSVIGSTHRLSHAVSPARHVALHAPTLHTSPGSHALLQEPQWLGSSVASTHASPQLS